MVSIYRLSHSPRRVALGQAVSVCSFIHYRKISGIPWKQLICSQYALENLATLYVVFQCCSQTVQPYILINLVRSAQQYSGIEPRLTKLIGIHPSSWQQYSHTFTTFSIWSLSVFGHFQYLVTFSIWLQEARAHKNGWLE